MKSIVSIFIPSNASNCQKIPPAVVTRRQSMFMGLMSERHRDAEFLEFPPTTNRLVGCPIGGDRSTKKWLGIDEFLEWPEVFPDIPLYTQSIRVPQL